jgi:hypothetical protein
MKKLFVLAFGIVALIPVVSGTTVPASTGATATVAQADLAPELLQTLKAQAAGGSLSRPL